MATPDNLCLFDFGEPGICAPAEVHVRCDPDPVADGGRMLARARFRWPRSGLEK